MQNKSATLVCAYFIRQRDIKFLYRCPMKLTWCDLPVKILNPIGIRSCSDRITLIQLCNVAYVIAFTRYGMGLKIVSVFSSLRVIPYSYCLRPLSSDILVTSLVPACQAKRDFSAIDGFFDGMHFGFLLCASHATSIILLTAILC